MANDPVDFRRVGNVPSSNSFHVALHRNVQTEVFSLELFLEARSWLVMELFNKIFLRMEHFEILKIALFRQLVWRWARRGSKRSRHDKKS